MTNTLYAHQEETATFITPKEESFITSTPGTGKTISMLEVYHRRNDGKLLVLCPKSIMEAAWYNDATEFYSNTPVGVFNRVHLARDPQYYLLHLFENNDIVIVNTDAAQYLLDHALPYLHDYSQFVLDEFTYVKNPAAQRSKAVQKLSEAFVYKTLMSGSPTPNSLLDIFQPTLIVDGGKRFGKNYFAFRNCICQPVMKGNFKTYTEWEVIPGSEDVVGEALRDITIRHELEDVIDMPERLYRNIAITMPKKLRAAYEEMKANAILELQNENIQAVNAAVLGGKLLQITAGSIYNNTGEGKLIDEDKYKLILQLIEERPHSLVFYQWGHQLACLEKLLKQAKVSYAVINGHTSQINRGKIVTDFQAGKYKTCLLQPAAAAHGLTLTRSTTSIWCSPTFNLEHFLQANYRDYRIGQTQRSEVLMVQYKDTCEQKVYNNLRLKRKSQDHLLEILTS